MPLSAAAQALACAAVVALSRQACAVAIDLSSFDSQPESAMTPIESAESVRPAMYLRDMMITSNGRGAAAPATVVACNICIIRLTESWP